eukprot:828846_1
MSKTQKALMNALKQHHEPNKSDQETQQRQLHELQKKRREIEQEIFEFRKTESMLDVAYGTEHLEMNISMELNSKTQEMDKLTRDIAKQIETLSANGKYGKIIGFTEDKRLIQHDYTPGSMKGNTIKNNIKEYKVLATSIDDLYDSE